MKYGSYVLTYAVFLSLVVGHIVGMSVSVGFILIDFM